MLNPRVRVCEKSPRSRIREPRNFLFSIVEISRSREMIYITSRLLGIGFSDSRDLDFFSTRILGSHTILIKGIGASRMLHLEHCAIFSPARSDPAELMESKFEQHM